MNPEIIVVSIFIGILLIIFFMHLFFVANKFDREINLSLTIMAIILIAYFVFYIFKYNVQGLDKFVYFDKWINFNLILIAIPFIHFVANYTGYKNKPFIIFIDILLVLLIVINFFSPFGITFSEIVLPETINKPINYKVFPLYGTFNPWMNAAGLTLLGLLIYLFLSVRYLFRKGKRLDAYFLFTAFGIVILAVLIDIYILNIPAELSFIFVLGVMSFRVFRDVIKTAEIKRTLYEAEDKLDRIINNSNIGIYQQSTSYEFLLVNKAFCRILGYSEREIYNLSLYPDIFLSAEEMKKFYDELNKKNSVDNYELRIKKKNNRDITVKTYARLITNKLGKRIIEGTIEDVSAQKDSERLLLEAKEEAEKADKLKSDFLAQMSHEIRTPVNSILNFSNLLQNELKNKVDSELSEGFSIIDSGGRRLIRTVDQILNMSQIQSESMELFPTKINLEEILSQLLNEFRNAAKVKNIELKLIKSKSDYLIFGDEYTIIQLFANLIDNAIKYTKEGFVNVKLAQPDRKKIIVSVNDSGVGISAEYLENIFEPFSQEEIGYTRKFEGTGLGLALVKKYCELNNAEVHCESIKGKGSSFKITFLPIENNHI
jgi:PAS domain S-box-containing protein